MCAAVSVSSSPDGVTKTALSRLLGPERKDGKSQLDGNSVGRGTDAAFN